MSIRRSKFQISIEVLTAISDGEQQPTRIMNACNLSWNKIKDTLDFLYVKGYVDETCEAQRRKRYSVTADGREIIEYLNGLQELVPVSINI